MSAFHEVLFPLDIALKSSGGPERRTEIVSFGSGREHRNARWQHSRRRFDAGYGVKTLASLQAVVAFFEERRGPLYGFRWRDRLDHSSAATGAAITPRDQSIGQGDGATTRFALCKTYGALYSPYARPIVKPVSGSIRIAVDGVELSPSAWSCDVSSGQVTLAAAPGIGAQVTAGFQFDVPVRFDTDFLEVDLSAFTAGVIPKIPLVEIRV